MNRSGAARGATHPRKPSGGGGAGAAYFGRTKQNREFAKRFSRHPAHRLVAKIAPAKPGFVVSTNRGRAPPRHRSARRVPSRLLRLTPSRLRSAGPCCSWCPWWRGVMNFFGASGTLRLFGRTNCFPFYRPRKNNFRSPLTIDKKLSIIRTRFPEQSGFGKAMRQSGLERTT